jgi:hypothetical protein
VKGGKYQSKTRGMVAMLKGKATTLMGSRKVLAIGEIRMVLRSRSGIEEEKEKC